VPFFRLNHSGGLPLVALLAACIMGSGCVTRKPPPPPPVVYPAVPETSLRDLSRLPPGLYDRVEIVTVAAEVGEQFASALKNARQTAAQKCANALVLLKDTEFRQKVGRRKLRVRRITYLAIHTR
jgi:hypothetical protein